MLENQVRIVILTATLYECITASLHFIFALLNGSPDVRQSISTLCTFYLCFGALLVNNCLSDLVIIK